MSSLLGGQVNPTVVPPSVGLTQQQAFFNALFGLGTTPNSSGTGSTVQGLAAFPGATTNPNTSSTAPNVNNTMLPGVYNNWQPWNQGTEGISSMLSNGQLNPTQQNPFLSPLISQGGATGPGTTAMSNIMQFGTPSQGIGQEMQNLAQFGAAGPAGQPLSNLAQGQATGAAAYLAPFLTGSQAPVSMPNINMPALGVGA
jgi:hypothetical protein